MALPRPTAKQVLPIVFLTILLDLLGFGLVIPIAPFYAQHFGATPKVITLLGAAYSLMQLIFMPMWGRLSDRIGRRPVILMSVAVSCVGYLWFGLASQLWMLFAARILAGFGNANIGAAQAIIADTTEPSERARGMGMIGAAFGIGFVLGPVFGGILGKIDLALPSYVAAGLGLINWIIAWIRLPETRDPEHIEARKALPPGALLTLMKKPSVVRLLLVTFTVTTGFALMEQISGLFIQSIWVPTPDLSVTEAISGLFTQQAWLPIPVKSLMAENVEQLHKQAAVLSTAVLAAVGLTMVIVQGGLIGRLVKRFGEGSLLRFGTMTLTVGLLGMAVVGTYGWYPGMFIASIVLAFGSALNTPSATSLLSQHAKAEQQGGLLGVGQSMSAAGRVIGPVMAGALFEVEGRLPLLIGAVLTFIAFILTLRVGPPVLPHNTQTD